MNNTQPKPTEQPFDRRSRKRWQIPVISQPKPTGEWTVEAIARETVLRWRGKLSDPETFEYLYENILAAINAALAAEREKVVVKAHKLIDGTNYAKLHQEIQELREQLAPRLMETVAVDAIESEPQWHDGTIREQLTECEKQLAAERDSWDISPKIRELREQIAATERTLEAAYERWRIIEKRAHADYTRELNAKLAQINSQAKTIRELTKLLRTIHLYPATVTPEQIENQLSELGYGRYEQTD